jgi:hypothetical protein
MLKPLRLSAQLKSEIHHRLSRVRYPHRLSGQNEALSATDTPLFPKVQVGSVKSRNFLVNVLPFYRRVSFWSRDAARMKQPCKCKPCPCPCPSGKLLAVPRRPTTARAGDSASIIGLDKQTCYFRTSSGMNTFSRHCPNCSSKKVSRPPCFSHIVRLSIHVTQLQQPNPPRGGDLGSVHVPAAWPVCLDHPI